MKPREYVADRDYLVHGHQIRRASIHGKWTVTFDHRVVHTDGTLREATAWVMDKIRKQKRSRKVKP